MYGMGKASMSGPRSTGYEMMQPPRMGMVPAGPSAGYSGAPRMMNIQAPGPSSYQMRGPSNVPAANFGMHATSVSLEMPSSFQGGEPEMIRYGGGMQEPSQSQALSSSAVVPSPQKKAPANVNIIDIEKYSKLVGWDRLTRAPDDVVIGLLNAIYDNISEMENLTSEKRIYELVKLLKEYLNLLLVPTYEFQTYFEQYLKRLIKDQNWISITTAQALCISVTAPDDEKTPVNRKFFCNYCTLSYSSSLFTCQMCQYSFKHIADLQAHEYQSHGISNKALYVCDICTQSFPHSPMQLRDHIYEKHICSRKHLECPFGCEKLILNMSEFSYTDHIKSTHQCSKCKDMVQGSMDIHMQMFHNEKRRVEMSPDEPRRSEKHSSRGSSSRRLDGRSRDRGDMPRGRSSPPVAPARSRSPLPSGKGRSSDYNNIMDVDVAKAQETLREMQRAKELMGRIDNSSSGEHFHYQEPQSKAKWPQCKMCKLQQPPGGFKCGKCNQTFPYRVFLFKHMKDAHKMIMPRSFECEMCAKVFSDISFLHHHVTKEAHVCSYEHLQCTYGCMMLFQNKNSLDVHTNAKHEFMCHICEAPVVNQTKKKHFSLYHPGEKFIAPTETLNSEESILGNAVSSAASQNPQTITLAPRILNQMRQSILNLAANRQDLFMTMPPPALSEKAFASRSKTQLVNMGYIHCRRCELAYHPSLPVCKRCNNVPFLSMAALKEHQVAVHKHADNSGYKECPVVTCGGKFQTYLQLMNHQVEHYCREHTECPFGCKTLIEGGDAVLVHHCRIMHPNKEIPNLNSVGGRRDEAVTTENFVSLQKLQEKMQKKGSRADDQAMEIEVTLKCIDCAYTCSDDTIRICEHCPPANAFKCADSDELRGHLSEFHKLFIKGDFVCTICSSKRDQPLKFLDDPIKYLEHRRKVHGICTAHQRCPNLPCLVMFDPKSVAGSKHIRMLCNFMKEPPQPDVTDGDPWKNPGWKMCLKCRFTAEVTQIFVCDNCEDPKPFFFKDEYYAHLTLTHSYKAEYTFVCFVCKAQFGSNAKAWLHHRESQHRICDQHLVCNQKDCVWMAPNRSEIEHHLQQDNCMEHEIRGVVEDTKICHVCSQIFSDGVIFQCVMCTRSKQQFMSLLEYLVHIENIHDHKIKGNFDCLECNFSSSTPFALSKHNHAVHRKCPSHKFCPNNVKCSVVFPAESLNKEHQCLFAMDSALKSLETPPKRRLADRIDSFQAPEQRVIRSPIVSEKPKVIDIDDSEELKCNECGFRAEKKEDLKCSVCAKTCISEIELCAHMGSEHNSIVRGKFDCIFCVPKNVFEGHPSKVLDHYEKVHKFCRHHKKNADRSALVPVSKSEKALSKLGSLKRIDPPTSKVSRPEDKFLEAIGMAKKSDQEPVIVVNIDNSRPLIEDMENFARRQREKALPIDRERTIGSSVNRRSALEPKIIREPIRPASPPKEPELPKLPEKYKIATSGKTKLYVCRSCNYRSIMPPPGKFKGDMKCKQRNCGLIFHQKYELVAHLELAHNKPLPPIKAKMVCEFCRDANVKNPFAHNASVPLCEHKKLEHGCCRTHIVCPSEKCTLMFPTLDLLEQHHNEKKCEILYVSTGVDEEKEEEKLEVWSKNTESLSMWKKRKTGDPEKMLTCLSCSLKAESTDCGIGSFNCDHCSTAGKKLAFAFKFELLAHMLRDHSMNKETQARFKCDICDDKEVSAISLVAHRKTKHNFCTVHYRCTKPSCNKLFSNENDLRRHEVKCEPSSKKTKSPAKTSKDEKAERTQDLVAKYGLKEAQSFKLYECGTCARKFGCMTIYKCNQCPESVSNSSKQFVNLVEFFAHLKEAHKIETDIEHSCALCDRFKSNAYELQKHVMEKHQVCGQHYLCPRMCKYLFKDKEALLEHYQKGTCTKPDSPKRKISDFERTPAKRRLGDGSSGSSPAARQEPSDNSSDKPKWDDMMANMLKYTDELLSDEDSSKPKIMKVDKANLNQDDGGVILPNDMDEESQAAGQINDSFKESGASQEPECEKSFQELQNVVLIDDENEEELETKDAENYSTSNDGNENDCEFASQNGDAQNNALVEPEEGFGYSADENAATDAGIEGEENPGAKIKTAVEENSGASNAFDESVNDELEIDTMGEDDSFTVEFS
ncbi:uncharacterized protein LOC134839362 isoform X2 [Symsagittifera roscoffensis]